MIIDRSWTLLFKTKKDIRDTRPLAYHGRIIEGLTHNPKSPWKDTKIWCGYTDLAEQMNTKDMEQWQEIQPDSLPSSVSDADVLVKGPLKMQQIGKDAAEKVLRGLLDDMDLPGRSPVLIVDMNAIVGNFADAFISVRAQINRSLYYIGFVDDPMGLDWLQETKLNYIADCVAMGSVKIPGHNPNPVEVTALIEQRPVRPLLNVLTFGKDNADGLPQCLHLPKAHQTWITHPKYGMQFTEFLDKMKETHPDVDVSLNEEHGSDPKRPLPSGAAPDAQK